MPADRWTKHDWHCPGAWRNGRQTTVVNLDLAIYLHMLHEQQQVYLKIAEVWRVGRGRHEIVFDDPDDIVWKLQLDFVNDPLAAGLMSSQKRLKTIMRERARERPGDRRAV